MPPGWVGGKVPGVEKIFGVEGGEAVVEGAMGEM